MRTALAVAFVLLASCREGAGTQGPPGPAGAEGPQGPPGPAGVAGPEGPQGPAGPQGNKGDKGDPGMVLIVDGGVLTGPQGLPGASIAASAVDAGSDCATGGVRITQADGGTLYVCHGAVGPAGPMGATGATGPQGPQGNTGATGAAGPQGPQGNTGPAGSTGPAGPVGPQGPAGPAGGSTLEDPAGFAGFTSTSYTGAIPGGRIGAHAACAAEFTGAHLCHASEYLLTNSGSTPPANGAWIDSSVTYANGNAAWGASPLFGRGLNYDCLSWTNATATYSGAVVTANGNVVSGVSPAYCSASRPLACCNGQSKVTFRGFTTFTTSGAIANGRAGAHARCAQEFAGSHLCHASEYLRANSPVAAPANGAWIDSSIDGDGTAVWGASPIFGRGLNYDCLSWTNATATYSGAVVTANGNVVSGVSPAYCSAVRALACCQ